MKREKQELLFKVLGNGKYVVDSEKGVLMSYRKAKGCFVVVKPNVLPTGYKQHVMYLGRGMGERVVVYLHVLVWISVYGVYEEGMVVEFIDGDVGNCSIDNLRLCSSVESVSSSLVNRPDVYGKVKTIRSNEIFYIREMMDKGFSQSRIARELGLNRLSVRYVYNKIKNGEALKYEGMSYLEAF